MDSIKAIISHVDSDVITLNETMLKDDRKLVLTGFERFTLNRNGKDGGGVANCVRRKELEETLKTFEGKDDLELIIPRHSQFTTTVDIINFYGVVESRAKKEDIDRRWNIIKSQITKIEAEGEFLILIGDLNAHVGDFIPGNSSKKSYGGSLLHEFLNNNDNYVLVNSSNKTSGGPYTRIDPADPSKKSALDLCLVSAELYPYIKSMVVDDARIFTPFRPLSKTQVTYTDHYAIRLTFQNLPVVNKRTIKRKGITRWNTN